MLFPGFLEWTGIWAGLLTVVLAVGAGGSWIIARQHTRVSTCFGGEPGLSRAERLQLEPEVAAQLLASQCVRVCEGNRIRSVSVRLDFLKPLLNVYQLLFLARARISSYLILRPQTAS